MSQELGIDTWICSWWGPESWEDETLQTVVLPTLSKDSAERPAIDFCLLYESAGLLDFDPERGIEFTPALTSRFRAHFKYIAGKYFAHPAYRRIEGKPVVYLYLSRTFSRDFADAIAEIRQTVSELGYSMFLIGDEVYWGEPNRERIALFDGITAYNMHGPPRFANLGDYEEFVDECRLTYMRYRVVAAEVGTHFIPGIMPGFDATGTVGGEGYYVIPRDLHPGSSETVLESMRRMALPLIDPKLKLITLTSFNEWHEGTQLEPSAKVEGNE